MWYPILFLVIGVVIVGFGQLVGWISNRPKNREDVQGIKAGCVISSIGAIIVMISLGVLAIRIGPLFR